MYLTKANDQQFGFWVLELIRSWYGDKVKHVEKVQVGLKGARRKSLRGGLAKRKGIRVNIVGYVSAILISPSHVRGRVGVYRG